MRNPAAALALLLPVAAFAVPDPAAGQPLSVEDGAFARDGAAYRGYGVNYYDAFLRNLRDASDTSYEAGFRELGRRGIPFARINAGGFFPADLDLYQSDRAEYLRRLDGVVASAERNGVGLVPSLFWNRFAVPDLVGEPLDAWGDADSRTRGFARQYARDVVGRYSDSPAVLMWEFGNEFNLGQDLPNQPDPDDRFSSNDVRSAIAEFDAIVGQVDPDALTTTGHSVARPAAATLRRTGEFGRDTRAEFRQITQGDHAGVDVISVHAYYHSLLGVDRLAVDEPATRFDEPDVTYEEVLSELVAAAEAAGKPLFVGEFGVAEAFEWEVSPGVPADDAGRLRLLLDAYVDQGVDLAALWVYDFSLPNADIERLGWNIEPDGGDRSYQLDLLADYNRIIAVPEPAGLAVGLALPALLLRRRR